MPALRMRRTALPRRELDRMRRDLEALVDAGRRGLAGLGSARLTCLGLLYNPLDTPEGERLDSAVEEAWARLEEKTGPYKLLVYLEARRAPLSLLASVTEAHAAYARAVALAKRLAAQLGLPLDKPWAVLLDPSTSTAVTVRCCEGQEPPVFIKALARALELCGAHQQPPPPAAPALLPLIAEAAAAFLRAVAGGD